MMLRNNFINSRILIRESLNSLFLYFNNATRLTIYHNNIATFYLKSRNNPKHAIHIKSKIITINKMAFI